MKKLVRKKRKQNRKSELIIILLVLLAVGSFVFLRSGYFDIADISVEGNVRLDSQEIISCGGIIRGSNIFSLKSSKAEKKINSLVMVKSVSVKKIFPNKVRVIVTEKEAFLTAVINEVYYAMDEEASVIYSCEQLSEDYGILLTGLSDVELIVGNTYNYTSNAKTATAFEVARWLRTSSLNDKISEIYASPGGYYYLYTNKPNVIKFYSLEGFNSNLEFTEVFLENEDRYIMVELVEGSEPVFKVININ